MKNFSQNLPVLVEYLGKYHVKGSKLVIILYILILSKINIK